MAQQIIVVKAARDPDAGVWFIESSDLPGLNAEAETIEALVDKLPALISDLVSEGRPDGGVDGDGSDEHDVPIELIAHASTRVRIRVDT